LSNLLNLDAKILVLKILAPLMRSARKQTLSTVGGNSLDGM